MDKSRAFKDATTMTRQWPKAKFITRSDRTVLTLGDLPATDTERWVMSRKVDVVQAVHGGLITMEDACWRYALTIDEFHSWEIAVERLGAAGLNTKRAQDDRRAERNAGVFRRNTEPASLTVLESVRELRSSETGESLKMPMLAAQKTK
jgi:uncharacterized protein DUF1153